MNAFRLLVYAIAAFAVIAFILLYLAPLFFPSEKPLQAMGEQLDKAELNLGTYTSRSVTFNGGSLIPASNLDSSSRSVRFQCTDAGICCSLNEDCGRIEWDERKVRFNQSLSVKTSYRCEYEAGIYSCTIYLGEAPAQVELLNVPEELAFDLNAVEAVIALQVLNSGGRDMLNPVQISYSVSKFFADTGQKEFRFEGSAEAAALDAGESLPATILLEKRRFLEDGEHVIEIKAESVEAGYDEASIDLQISNVPIESCETDYEGGLQWIDIGCIKKYYCQDCRLAVQCASAWAKEGKNVENYTPEYAVESFPSLTEGQCQ